MATKRTRSGPKAKTKTPASKARAKAKPPAARPAPKAAPATTARPAVAARPSGPSPLGRAEALRDAIQRSKLTAPDPWAYTPKARGWAERAQQLVDRLAREGGAAAARQALDKFAAEVEGDRDFQAARRLF